MPSTLASTIANREWKSLGKSRWKSCYRFNQVNWINFAYGIQALVQARIQVNKMDIYTSICDDYELDYEASYEASYEV